MSTRVLPNLSSEKRDWLIALDPKLKAVLGAAPAAEEEGGGGPGAAAEGAAGAEGHAKAGTEVDVLTVKMVDHPTKYGAIKVTATFKAASTTGGEGEAGKTYTANDSRHRESGVKKAFSLAEMRDSHMLGLDIEKVSLEIETEFSGEEVVVGANLGFELKTKLFKAPAKSQAKLTVLKYNHKEGFSLPGVELSITQASETIATGGVSTVLSAEFKGGFAVDKEKVAKEIGKKVVKKLAEEAIEKEAKRLGVKALGRAAGEAVLKDLGPVAAAFSVGLDIGEFLNEFTVAPKVAGAVDDAILGDLNERYQKADTLGKMWLLSKNSPRIVAALVASGVAGAVTGMADLVLFKIMGLPTAKDFKEALDAFGKGMTELAKVATAVPKAMVDSMGGGIVTTAFVMGIKTNPKYSKFSEKTLAPIFGGIYKVLKPCYVENGINKIIPLKVGNAQIAAGDWSAFAKTMINIGDDRSGELDLSSEAAVIKSMQAMQLVAFIQLAEDYTMVSYSVKLSDSLDPDDLDQKLVDELMKQ